MKTSLRLFTLAVIAALLLSACAVTSRNALLGKWSNTTQDLTLEFTMDGHLRNTSQGVTQELGFQFLDNSTIALIAPNVAGNPQPIPFTIDGDKLTLNLGSDASGQPQALDFQRVK
jgi:hypothetical protein